MINTCKATAIFTAALACVIVSGCSLVPGIGSDTATAVHHINLGASDDTTINGQHWRAGTPSGMDTPWSIDGGSTVSYDDSTDIRGTDLDLIYQTGLEGLNAISIDVPKDRYVVQLHFAETSPDVKKMGQRTFDVDVEGVTVLNNFDPLTTAGDPRTASIQTIDNVLVEDGTLNVNFTEQTGPALIHGISVYVK